ncbi:MAG: hypothetical protein N2112_03415 [Gemmataceae bacterium]|jgi:hypothetical protein|nr:hypothetical protein [Gemmataceae bacterium]
MDYAKAYLFFLRKPQTGFKNVLFGTIISLIPAIGPIIFLGYMVVIAEWLLKDEKRENYPDFSFDRFLDYLKLGLWPFVTVLIFSLLIILPIYLILAAIAFGIGIALDEPILIPIILAILGLFLGFMISYVMGPLLLYSQKYQKLDIKGASRFALNFVKTLGFKHVIVVIINMMLSFLVTLIGFLFCLIGIYPANTVSQVAYEHILIQLYDEYLALGGDRLPSVDLPHELAFQPSDLNQSRRFSQEQKDYDDSEF